MINSKTAIFIFALLLLTITFACKRTSEFKQTSDGVIIKLEDNYMQLKVYNDEIIRVMVSQVDTFSTRKSLMIEKKDWDKSNFKLYVEEGVLVLSTAKISAKVNLDSGVLNFYDLNDKLLLAEREGGGKKIERAIVSGENTYHIRQQWDSPDDEFLHGLGHHQNGIFNLKGIDIDLWQENWEVVVPFFVSNKGYGILWDNYSHSKWGFPVTQDYIPSTMLFNKEGQQGSLSGSYYTGINFDELKAERNDSTINFDFKTFGPQIDNSFTTDPDWMSKPLNNEINPGKFSVRWEGQVKSMHAGEYAFHTFSTHNVRLWINDELLVDGWNTTNMYLSGKINLDANTLYSIKMEWVKDEDSPIHQASNGATQLRWAPPSQESFDGITMSSEVGDMIDYYFCYGPSMDKVISNYRDLTGKAPMFGDYAYGYWHSHIKIQSQKEYLDLIKEFRSREIPLDVLVQDLNYWVPEEWGSHHFNPDRYPNPKKMIDQAHEQNIKYAVSVWGMFQKGSDNWKELMDKDLLFGYNNCSFWTDKGTWYFNPFSSEGREVYWQQMNRELFSKGVDVWWLDASEPEISTPADPFLYKNVMDNNLGTGARYLNAFSLMQTKAIYEGQRKTDKNKRALILGRSAYAGQQKNGTVIWTGDIAGTWEVFRKQIICGLNFNLSGLPYWTTDIGGFFINKPDWPLLNKDPGYRELYTRWFQFGVFCPVLRTHGNGPRREMWLLGDESYQIQKDFDILRHRLFPYIYSNAGNITHHNSTLMRPLVMDFQDDEKALAVDNEYMFGDAFLVCPVIQANVKTQSCYLPKKTQWINFWTGEKLEGGVNVVVKTPLNQIPLFVKAGSIVPFGPSVQYIGEKKDSPIEIRIYPGANGAFILYEDEGENYNYENGTFSEISFEWNENKKQLTIGKRLGSFNGMVETRSFNISIVSTKNGKGIDAVIIPDEVVSYSGEKLLINF